MQRQGIIFGYLSVTAKIRNLSEFNNRLMQGTVPSPSGMDIASSLKFFNQLLLG